MAIEQGPPAGFEIPGPGWVWGEGSTVYGVASDLTIVNLGEVDNDFLRVFDPSRWLRFTPGTLMYLTLHPNPEKW